MNRAQRLVSNTIIPALLLMVAITAYGDTQRFTGGTGSSTVLLVT